MIKDPREAFLAEKSIERDLGCGTRWEVPSELARFKAGEDGLGETDGEKLGGKEGDGDRAGRELRAGVSKLAGTPVSLCAPGITRDGRGAGVGGKDRGICRGLGDGKVIVGTSSSSSAAIST